MSVIKIVGDEYFLNREITAVLCGVDPATITNWRKQPDPPPFTEAHNGFNAADLGHWIRKKQTLKRGRGGSYPFLPEMGSIAQVEVPTLPGLSPTPLPQMAPMADKHTEETRLKKAQADKIELELAIKAGEYVPKSDVESAFIDMATQIKTKLLKIPSSLAPVVIGIKDMYEIQQLIEDQIREAMEALADGGATDERDEE